ncbi:MAG: phosphatase PAP2 family protein [Actinomycetota bacterium]|nr:phosphatase PAP2 family protein [Actinomycetota bacterium]
MLFERRSRRSTFILLVGAGLLLFVVLLLVGLAISRYLGDDALGRMDRGLARYLARNRSSGLNQTTEILSYLAETTTVIGLGVLLFVGTRLTWKRWGDSLLVLAALAGEVVIFLGLTVLVDRNRPMVHRLDVAPPTSSFPSGHMAAAIVLYGVVAIIASRHLRSRVVVVLLWLLAIVVPLAVGAARMYRGMHYFTDVVGGGVLGTVWLTVSARVLAPFRSWRSARRG